MTKYVRTTTNVTFRNMDANDLPEGMTYEGNCVSAGFICRVIVELDPGDTVIQSVKYPHWTAEVHQDQVEEINAMEFLAEVHAGNVPEEALKEGPV